MLSVTCINGMHVETNLCDIDIIIKITIELKECIQRYTLPGAIRLDMCLTSTLIRYNCSMQFIYKSINIICFIFIFHLNLFDYLYYNTITIIFWTE